MKTITETKTLYEFSELSESAKDVALTWHRETLHDWWDCTYDDAKVIASLMGWDIDKIYFSGFWSQGDGACFEGHLRYAKGCANAVREYAPKDDVLYSIADDWQALQARNFYGLTASVKQSGHYYHAYCTSFDCYSKGDWLDCPETEKAIITIARRFMQWIYRQLEQEYDYQASAEVLEETADCNGWMFLESGRFYGSAE